ncbi:MOSC domain-containing protein [Streptomyces acidiscabies]|uniref:MOSC domain-containing protein n=1 Tax=Streptomyces acidiscabies TaxID=42234 RepID=A0AAP6EEE5_9ACTN|nr:MOSC N-terminal beta barrel domain-containing protein [Streptomyces acidiscabies]MBP5939494.1 MOSC domain-containing protein [Streptomyces sp. LBUM 1476]MBZ3910644.1 MOSC domain-containing protein [Streptomyces acidiscabies]MDX2959644.1 MOSC domain-containing protein [Streptomyces acidiscabies]MDX3019068.1 MOSC domain-containing protein [Streptomyces acidiscabies]MDX3790851.1 MOSC domain-containing protein [Streptomyces acidiscabies]
MIASVTQLHRYPVKSMLGERLPAATLTDRGLTGDRRLALLDRETGKIASAKSPRLWRELPRCTAVSAAAGVHITTPDGHRIAADDPGVHEALSAHLGREVTLIDVPPPAASLDRDRPEEVLDQGVTAQVAHDVVRFGSAAPPGTFFDFAPVHLVTTSTLRTLAALSPRGTVEAERYRANLVIGTAGEGFPEHAWVGRELAIGDAVLQIIASTPRCAVPTLEHGQLPRDPEALRIPALHNRVPALPGRQPEPCVGVYAKVVRGGSVREGDAVRL